MVSWGCSGGVQRSCGDHLNLASTRGFMENPYLERLADFSYMHVEMWWICPMWPSTPLATKRASLDEQPCRLAIPLIMGQKIADFLKKTFFIFSTLFTGYFAQFAAGGHIPRLTCYFSDLVAPGRLNAAWI